MPESHGLWIEPRSGAGAPALFIHPSLASRRALEPLAATLPDLDPAWLDLPGHGSSSDAPDDLLRRSAAAAATALDRPAFVLGHSFGAVVALRLALDGAPVERLVLVEPVLFAAARGSDAYRAHETGFQPVAEALARDDTETAARAFLTLFGDGTPWDALPDRVRASMARRMWTIAATRPDLVEDRTGILAPGVLGALDMPVLLVRGSDTHPVIPEIHRALLARLPRATEVVIDGAGHMAPITHVRGVADAIRSWNDDPAS